MQTDNTLILVLKEFLVLKDNNILDKQVGQTSKLDTLKPHQKLEKSYHNILTTT